MKQFFALAALFAVLGVSAQEKQIQEPKHNHSNGHEQMDCQHGEMYKMGHEKHGFKMQKPTIDQQVALFNKYDLNTSQQKEIKSLLESREKQMKKDFEKRKKEMIKSKENFEKQQQNFDKKLEKIFDQEQYAKFKEDHQNKFQGKKEMKGKHVHGHRGHKTMKNVEALN